MLRTILGIRIQITKKLWELGVPCGWSRGWGTWWKWSHHVLFSKYLSDRREEVAYPRAQRAPWCTLLLSVVQELSVLLVFTGLHPGPLHLQCPTRYLWTNGKHPDCLAMTCIGFDTTLMKFLKIQWGITSKEKSKLDILSPLPTIWWVRLILKVKCPFWEMCFDSFPSWRGPGAVKCFLGNPGYATS